MVYLTIFSLWCSNGLQVVFIFINLYSWLHFQIHFTERYQDPKTIKNSIDKDNQYKNQIRGCCCCCCIMWHDSCLIPTRLRVRLRPSVRITDVNLLRDLEERPTVACVLGDAVESIWQTGSASSQTPAHCMGGGRYQLHFTSSTTCTYLLLFNEDGVVCYLSMLLQL